MKIDNIITPTTAPPSNRVKSQPNNANASAAASSSDDVKLSPLAGQLQAGESQPPIDSARVEEIKRAISEGRFSINADAIADRLIDTARELINTPRRA